jgi:hypothetical protein
MACRDGERPCQKDDVHKEVRVVRVHPSGKKQASYGEF